MQRCPQGNKRQNLARALVNLDFVVAGQQMLRRLKQVGEYVVEVGVVLEVTIQVVEVQINRSPPDLRIAGDELRQAWQLLPIRISGCIFRYWSKKIRREVTQLHDFPGITAKTKLLAYFLATLQMPIAVETGCGRNQQRSQRQESGELLHLFHPGKVGCTGQRGGMHKTAHGVPGACAFAFSMKEKRRT